VTSNQFYKTRISICRILFFASASLVFSSTARAENRILDIKDGYCITVQEPTNMAGAWCVSHAYYFRESDKKIYVCGVVVGGKLPASAIDKVPSEIGCHPLGRAPIGGTISMRSLGDRLNILQYVPSGSLQYSSFSWRGAYWLASNNKDALTFCVWSKDASDTPSPVACTEKIDWNKYINIPAVGSLLVDRN
jgi:hypothetical protein